MAEPTCNDSGSRETVVTSLIANGVIFIVFIVVFLILRPLNKRVYDSRSMSSEMSPGDKPRELRGGKFGWIFDLLTRSDAEILRDAGLDGYLFLRYLRFLGCVALFGIVLLLPILLPVNATNGIGCKGFDLLAFGNITNENRYFAHVFLSWIFFGVTIFGIYRELLFYTGLRQAVLTSESEKYLLSNRTVIVNDVPQKLLTEEYLRKIFTGVKHIIISRDATDLREIVEDRNKLASRLEGTENSMLKKALKNRLKSEKKGKIEEDSPAELNDYVKKPPTHRLGLWGIPFLGKKVETIPYAEEHIPQYSAEIEHLRQTYDDNEKSAAAFIIFNSQYDAEVAVQMLSFHRPLQMSPRFVGISPDEIVWTNLSMRWYKRLPVSLLIAAFLVLLIIFWAIPVAFAGFVSQIRTLTDWLPFLSFINNLPEVLHGLISALLPVVVVAIVMSLPPVIIRKCARYAGSPTDTMVEYYTQKYYFAFQVVQVFLVFALSSAIISAMQNILEDPSIVLDLLHKNLPQASNIFIAYLLLQCLTLPSGMLLQIVPLALYYALGTLLDNTPRKIWARRNTVGGPGWGTVYPVYSNMALIMFVYSIISPLIMPFSAAVFIFCYIAWLNNLIFCTAKTHYRGINYSRALQHLFVGIYIAEVILVILFVFSQSWGPLVLEVVMLLVTIWCHATFASAFNPMLFSLPRSLLESGSEQPSSVERKSSAGDDSMMKDPVPDYSSNPFVNDQETSLTGEKNAVSTSKHSGTFMDRFLKPHIYYAPEVLAREMLQDDYWHTAPANMMTDAEEADAFKDPAMGEGNPLVWFPEDKHGWATSQQQNLRDHGINAYTAGAWYEINEKKKKVSIEVTEDPAVSPVYKEPVAY